MYIHGYSSPLNLKHKALEGFFDGGPIYVQEKTDGSQFSFSRTEDDQLIFRSRSIQIDPQNPGMFLQAVQALTEIGHRLVPGYTYRGEYFSKPKHNTLAYSRIPLRHVIIFDVDTGDQDYLTPGVLETHVAELGLECVPLFDTIYAPPSKEQIEDWLNRESVLGGVDVEGVVLKNYRMFGQDHKTMMAKIVSEQFQEKHNKDWKKRNPNRADVVDQIIQDYGSEARWKKAVQHLSEQGELVNGPQDIGPLMKEISEDFEKEYSEEIGRAFWQHFRKQILRGIQGGFPEWYKEQL